MPSVQVYASTAELKVRIERTRDADDVNLLKLLTAASRSIDNACNRINDGFLAAVSSARLYGGSGQAVQRIDECISVSLVETKASRGATTWDAWVAADWSLFGGDQRWPNWNNAPFDKLMVDWNGDYSNFTSGSASGPGSYGWFLSTAQRVGLYNPRTARKVSTVRVTGFWGYAAETPPEIREATAMQAARWYKRYQGSMSDSLADGELGVLLYRKALDPDIRRILVDGRYVRRIVS